MLVGAKVCELTEDLLWFVCGLYVGILTSPLTYNNLFLSINRHHFLYWVQVGFVLGNMHDI